MSPESDVRSRYLALALEARKVIDALIVLVDQNKRVKDFEESLEEAIQSLQTVTDKAHVFSPGRSRLAFSEYYEQVRAVKEALKPNEREQIVEKLSAIKAKQTDSKEQKEDVYKAIKLLSAIESRALYHYRPQP